MGLTSLSQQFDSLPEQENSIPWHRTDILASIAKLLSGMQTWSANTATGRKDSMANVYIVRDHGDTNGVGGVRS